MSRTPRIELSFQFRQIKGNRRIHNSTSETRYYFGGKPSEGESLTSRHFAERTQYREPTEAEWTEFAQHFRRRKLALGDCYRPYGTDCPHEHACVRCPMLRMDVEQLPRLVQIETDTYRLLDEARRKGWEGEVAGLETTLVHIKEKQAQVKRLRGVDASLLTAPSSRDTMSLLITAATRF